MPYDRFELQNSFVETYAHSGETQRSQLSGMVDLLRNFRDMNPNRLNQLYTTGRLDNYTTAQWLSSADPNGFGTYHHDNREQLARQITHGMSSREQDPHTRRWGWSNNFVQQVHYIRPWPTGPLPGNNSASASSSAAASVQTNQPPLPGIGSFDPKSPYIWNAQESKYEVNPFWDGTTQ
ncbi:uncharacterized protein I303_104169 [Kwoniella dejecticola CBS 10117]|uniref:Uncharacterized protein n=1 Tax=Kwoniella dejecticola CBS 10117 TaxID=1296121 RepID=A0A1A6A627_9TREE|nr:uncharacterized protein I303_04853 [Kwoniella dejecticola CBS 10117]OBR85517.1 hypothetical protein I303_04853 [Kwoniella dejecticola CBS 10117]